MKHLSSEQVLSLSEKLIYKTVFSKEDELTMLHIAYCEECYNFLRSVMAANLFWIGQLHSC